MGVDELRFNGLRRHSKLTKGAKKGTERRRQIICGNGVHCDLPYIYQLSGSENSM